MCLEVHFAACKQQQYPRQTMPAAQLKHSCIARQSRRPALLCRSDVEGLAKVG